MNPIVKSYWVAKGVGFDNVPRRLLQAVRMRTGSLQRRLGQAENVEVEVAGLAEHGDVCERWRCYQGRFPKFPTAEQLSNVASGELWDESVTSVCNRALRGDYPFFSSWFGELGWPPDFSLDPVNNIEWPAGKSWLGNAKSGPPRDDIKLVWEASRLTVVFSFVRQYRISNDERWAEAIWDLIDSWIEQNPVNQSVAWGCGQEVAFRLFAILFGVFATLESNAASRDRLERIERLVVLSAKRIQANINYAISQKNNHGISEALGLWIVGAVFQEMSGSAAWMQQGEKTLVAEVERQIYDDGSFVQNSMSYHRVLLDDLCLYKAVCESANLRPHLSVCQRASDATQWLDRFVHPETGRVPNYGSNDGANVLPLSCSDYLDYRPSLVASSVLFDVPVNFGQRGPWDEKPLWLGGILPEWTGTAEQSAAEIWYAKDGGYFHCSSGEMGLFFRAVQHRDRPSQCDLLHVDLWFRGKCLLCDAGSFRYYHSNLELKNYFYSVAAHNTVQVAETEQMLKGPNFLWFNWPKCSSEVHASEITAIAEFSAGIKYRHQRRINLPSDSNQGGWSIVDEVLPNLEYCLRWRLSPDVPWVRETATIWSVDFGDRKVEMELPNPTAVIGRGVESLYYGQRREIEVVELNRLIGSVETKFRVI